MLILKTVVLFSFVFSCFAQAPGLTSLTADEFFLKAEAALDEDGRIIWRGQSAYVESSWDISDKLRSYVLRTTTDLRDASPHKKTRTITESTVAPYARSGNLLFDALFSLALFETDEARPDDGMIREPSYSLGRGIKCPCFETGEKWTFVWTRDISYSVDLALGMIDPETSLNSLLFKISKRREGRIPYRVKDEYEIVQDTGSGGSWPVSTDRVVWGLGIKEVLTYLDRSKREEILPKVISAVINTVELDRMSVFDADEGLYGGETSFLDWREQTYANWTKNNTVHIGMSKALSTNILHYKLIDLAAEFALRQNDGERHDRYQSWASELKKRINDKFWDSGKGLYRSFTVSKLHDHTVGQYDLLGQSLAILYDIADYDQAREIVASYPNTKAGAAVIWPQRPHTAIYHNRAIWPFVSSYYLLAAKKVKNDIVFNHTFETLVRGASLNLSNMENFEFLTLSNFFEDGSLSGPILNSRRQLWSVAGYVSMVMKGMFGIELNDDRLSLNPFITKYIRNHYLKKSNSLALNNVVIHGKKINIELQLPNKTDEVDGFYTNVKGWLNGSEIDINNISLHQLAERNKIVIKLESGRRNNSRMLYIDVPNPHRISKELTEVIWAPKTPVIYNTEVDSSSLTVYFHSNGERDVTYNIYKNGELVVSNYDESTWIDFSSHSHQNGPSCYVLESVYRATGNLSLPTLPYCFWPSGSIQQFNVSNGRLTSQGGSRISYDHGRKHFGNWGSPNDMAMVQHFNVLEDGKYYVQISYSNAYGPINTGITASVKKIVVTDETGHLVKSGVVFMPHMLTWSSWSESNFLSVELKANKRYQIRLIDHYNMSYLEHFKLYTAHAGGKAGINNRFNLEGIKLLRAP